MFTRRFVLLAGILVTLNLALWFASPGLALRRALTQQLFGPKLIRAEVLTKTGDWHLDNGVITRVTGSQLTLKEADGRVQVIALSPSTEVIRFGRHLPLSVLAPRWRVVVLSPASGPAVSVDVQHMAKTRGLRG